MPKILIMLTTATLVAGLLSACVEQASIQSQSGAGRAASADDLLIVDCLLPGQVRKLGSRMTYLSARRPIQTTTQDCEIRGGEYVAYDRATYSSALRIWQPLAEQGDPDAQNKIGEIYERGIAGTPDYALAALWYRRAAEQGFERAQINLGFLLEKGLGVKQDLKEALSWYRKASKLPDAVLIDQAELNAQKAHIVALKQRLEQSRTELEQARRDLRKRQRQLQHQRNKLSQALKNSPLSQLSDAQRRKLEANLKKLQTQRLALTQQQSRIKELESQSRQQQEHLLLMEAEGASLREQLELVQTQLQRSQQDLKQYQAAASENQRQLAKTRADLAALTSNREGAAYQHIQKLEAQLGSRESTLLEQKQKIALLEKKARQLQQQLAQTHKDNRVELSAMQQALEAAKDQLAKAQSKADEQAKALQKLQSELAAQKSNQDADGIRLVELEAQLKEREKSLAQQQAMVDRLSKESDQWRKKLKQLEQKKASGSARTADAEVPLAPPSIQLIDPPLLAVRGDQKNRIQVKRGLAQRTVVGQVTAPGGLFALTVNGLRIKPNPKGLFQTDIVVASDTTPVSMIAIDKQGRRATLAFSMVKASDAKTLVAKRENPLEGVAIGKFYALVIGNQNYQHLPDLDTSANDAAAVAEILRDKFGYRVTLLKDATRYQILSEFNRLRKELTDKDNLLVYYAGHGELDRVNLRGHWLPVDAELNSSANWISNVSITDILNAMSVRHVLMVADSCYSGALTRSSLSQLDAGQSSKARKHWLKTLSKMRSRTALTSGGLAPVLDGGGGEHSVFAKAFLAVLKNLSDITEGQRVYREVSARVAYEANRYQVEQVPEYAPIKYSGHEAGDFIFVPKHFL